MSARRKGRGPGCGLTFMLVVLILFVAGLTGVVGYMYLKDTGWLHKRNIQLDNKTGKPDVREDGGSGERDASAGLRELKDRLEKKLARPGDDGITAEEPEPVKERKAPPAKKDTVKKPADRTVEKPAPKRTVVQEAVRKVRQKEQGTAKGPATNTVRRQSSVPKPRDVTLYFIRYDESDDSISLSAATRKLSASDSPLEETMKMLFQGTTSDEDDRGYSSAIPGSVSILSLKVENGTAVVNLGSAFESGTGRKVMQARVYQVVYTATQFPTVKNVRVLVDGARKANFGGEGIDLTKPLSRSAGTTKF